MLKQMAWNIFKNTGDINTFLELKQVQDIEQNKTMQFNNANSKEINGETNGNFKDQGNSNTGK